MAIEIENSVCKRHCSVCEGMDHHWMPDFTASGEPVLACKHCDATKPYPDDEEPVDGCPECGARLPELCEREPHCNPVGR